MKYNIDRFCDYGLKTLNTLTDAGGNDSQAFEKFYEALKTTPNREFVNVLVVWRSVLDQTASDLEIGKLLDKARAEYIGMVALKTWSTCGSTIDSSIPKKSKQDKDIAALLASSEVANKKINVMTKALASQNRVVIPH